MNALIKVVDLDSFNKALLVKQTEEAEKWWLQILQIQKTYPSFSSPWLMKREETLFSTFLKLNDFEGATRCFNRSLFESRKIRMQKRIKRKFFRQEQPPVFLTN